MFFTEHTIECKIETSSNVYVCMSKETGDISLQSRYFSNEKLKIVSSTATMRFTYAHSLSKILLAPPLSARAKLRSVFCFSIFSASRLLSPQSGPNVTFTVTAKCATSDTMSQKPALTSEQTWKDLQEYYDSSGKCLVIKDLFAKDSNRFCKFR